MFLDEQKNKPNNSLQFGWVFGVPIAKITKNNLQTYLTNLPKNQKIGLNFAYSEVVLRANRNKSYHNAISQIINICDGKGLRWSLWKSQKYTKTRQNLRLSTQNLKNIKNQPTQNSKLRNKLSKFDQIALFLRAFFPRIFKKVVFWLELVFELIVNFLSGILILTGFDFGMEIILGRSFVYDLFDLALQKEWKIGVIGGSDLVQENLKQKFPNLEINFWFRKNNSNLMKDLPFLEEIKEIKTQNKTTKSYQKQPNLAQIHSFLNTQNLISNFPDLQNAEEWLIDKKADLVLICIGGASGKQEFFLDLIRQNENLNFDLGVCLGAALDHLGAGKKQRESPKIMQKVGLEWLFRLTEECEFGIRFGLCFGGRL
jgi:UDP-N-acetyl-D-mannosaminuronic acid transferase (WecB/TagA/CpsF family)